MNRILSVVRSMTDKIVELSRAVVATLTYGESKRRVGVGQLDMAVTTRPSRWDVGRRKRRRCSPDDELASACSIEVRGALEQERSLGAPSPRPRPGRSSACPKAAGAWWRSSRAPRPRAAAAHLRGLARLLRPRHAGDGQAPRSAPAARVQGVRLMRTSTGAPPPAGGRSTPAALGPELCSACSGCRRPLDLR